MTFFFKQLNSYSPILEKLFCHIIHWHYLSTWVLILIYIPYEFLALTLRKHYAWYRTVGFVVNRTFFSCRGFKFDSQHLHGSPQPNVTSVLGSSSFHPPSVPRVTHGTHAHMHLKHLYI